MSIYTEDLNLEDRRLFFKGYEVFCNLFGREAVDRELMKLKPSNLVEIYASPLDGPKDGQFRNFDGRCWQQPQRELDRGWDYVTFRNGDWEQHKRVPCRRYLVPYQYQNLCHSKIVEPILLEKFPWLSEFEFDIYSIDTYGDRRNEFYVTLSAAAKGHRSLYVPYDAFLAGDADAIIERTSSYLLDYTKSDEVWNIMKDDPVTIAFLAKVREIGK